MSAPQKMAVTILALCSALVPVRLSAEILPTEGRDLLPPPVYQSMQTWMLNERFDGWLFTGQGTFADIERELLGLKGQTRHRWFIFYAALSSLHQPFLIYHPDDEPLFAGVKFYPLPYHSYAEMVQTIKNNVFSVARDIAINYSSKLEISEVSQVDLGTVELLQEIGFRFRPAGSMLSFYHTRWTTGEVESHKYAAARLDSILPVAVENIRDRLIRGKKITDYDLARHIEKNLKKLDLEATSPVVVAVGANTLVEGYLPAKDAKIEIGPDSLVYIEVSARKRGEPGTMFARLGWTLVCSDSVKPGMKKAWGNIVAAADTALAILSNRVGTNTPLTGREVDEAARKLLGPKPDALPRPLGYNLNRQGNHYGVRFDSYLFVDDRIIMPGLGFTLEPGIYGNKYALRVCNNLFLEGSREVTLSAPLQRKLIPVLGDPSLLVEAFTPPLD